MARLSQNRLWNDITASESAANSIEALGKRHNCIRTGLGRLKMTLVSQNRLGGRSRMT